MTKEVNKQLINKILDSPEAPKIIEYLNTVIEEEKRKRVDFYQSITEEIKAEFINGEVIIHSPVAIEHNEVNGNLYKIIDTYVVANNLGFVGIEKILIRLTRNDYEPDLCYFNLEKSNKFEKGQNLFPAPNFIIEVLSKGTAKRDRGVKFEDYQDHGVEEYWIVDPQKKTIEQYLLKRNKYELVLKSKNGDIKSKAIKNLSFPVNIIFDKLLTYKFTRSL